MARRWTLATTLNLSFGALLGCVVLSIAVGVMALRSVAVANDRVLTVHVPNQLDAERLAKHGETLVAEARGVFLTGDSSFESPMREASGEFRKDIERLRSRVRTEEGRRIVDAIDVAERDFQGALEEVIRERRGGMGMEETLKAIRTRTLPRRMVLANQARGLLEREEGFVMAGQREVESATRFALWSFASVGAFALLLGGAMAVRLKSSVTRQIGGAVQSMKTSTTELQTAATEQASVLKEQATAMSEIGTTVTELLATSRQIAESSQRVATVASETAGAANHGNQTVIRAQESVTSIRSQVDLIVGHMLDLGKKSQQIGGILELINELSEQTNILAINATIEAAGAGESGRRFAVVADEIRRLADRVASFTKDIRVLIEEIRSSVNTTVMATEGGSKAVDNGARQVGEVATAFQDIVRLVGTTTDATREIELSTKQQTTGVEQVKIAIGEVAQGTKETQAAATQTLQTARQLAETSRDLSELIETNS